MEKDFVEVLKRNVKNTAFDMAALKRAGKNGLANNEEIRLKAFESIALEMEISDCDYRELCKAKYEAFNRVTNLDESGLKFYVREYMKLKKSNNTLAFF